jgi:hypothetical protein
MLDLRFGDGGARSGAVAPGAEGEGASVAGAGVLVGACETTDSVARADGTGAVAKAGGVAGRPGTITFTGTAGSALASSCLG